MGNAIILLLKKALTKEWAYFIIGISEVALT